MPAYNTGSATSPFPVSSDYRIAALQGNFTGGSFLEWTSTNLTYSFPSGAAQFDGGLNYGNGEVRAGWVALNESQKADVRKALAAWSAVAQVTFTEVADGANVGDLRFAFTSGVTSSEVAHAYQPANGSAVAGDVWIKSSLAGSSLSAATAPTNYSALLHEIGHALGLSHPFAKPGETHVTPVLPTAEDIKLNTVMSYTGDDWGGMPVTPMPYDILAIQHLYAANYLYRFGSDTYVYDVNNVNYETIWDAGGNDTLVVTNTGNATEANPVIIDIRPGQSSGIGFSSDFAKSYSVVADYGVVAPWRGTGKVAIAYGTIIENVVGTDAFDNITGNDANNVFSSGLGKDTMDGGPGIDTSVYSRPRSDYTLATINIVPRTGTGFTVTDKFRSTLSSWTKANSYFGQDTLYNMERLRFSDTKVALDVVLGNAGNTAKILGAVFGRAQATNKEYMGIGIGLLDGGMSYVGLMQAALNAKLGAGASNAAVVNLLYTNLTGAAPSASELNLYKGMLDSGTLTPANLGVIAAEHPLNYANINFTGLAETGIEYL